MLRNKRFCDLMSPLQAEWAAKRSRDGTPVGERCRECVRLRMIGWPLLTWEELLAKTKSSPEFKALVSEAKSCLRGKGQPVPGESFTQGSRTGYRVERTLTLVSAQRLDELLEMVPGRVIKAKELSQYGIHLDTVYDEYDRPLTGLLVDSGEDRRVILYSDHNTEFGKCLHKPDSTIRSGQGQEMASWFRADLSKTVSQGLRAANVPKLSELQSLLEKANMAKKATEEKDKLSHVKEEVKQEEEQKAPLQPEDTAEEPDPVDVYSPERLRVSLPSACANAKQRKAGKNLGGKGGKDSKEKKAKGGAGRGGQGRKGSAKSGPSHHGGASVAGSVGGGSNATCPEDSAVHYIQQLDIGAMLGGKNLGHLVGNAQRALGPMRRKDASSSPVLQISAHLELFKSAEKLRAGSISKLTKAERDKILSDLEHAKVQWPASAAVTLLSCCLKEEKDTKQAVRMMLPAPAAGEEAQEFEPKAPLLSSIKMPDTERARALHRLVVSDCLNPKIIEGSAVCKQVEEIVRELSASFNDVYVVALSPFMQSAVQEILVVCRALIGMQTSSGQEAMACKPDFRSLMSATSGSKLLVRQACHLPTPPHLLP